MKNKIYGSFALGTSSLALMLALSACGDGSPGIQPGANSAALNNNCNGQINPGQVNPQTGYPQNYQNAPLTCSANYTYGAPGAGLSGAAVNDYKSWTTLESQMTSSGANFSANSALGNQSYSYFSWNGAYSYSASYSSSYSGSNSGSNFTDSIPVSSQNLRIASQYVALGNKILNEQGVDHTTALYVQARTAAVQKWLDVNDGVYAKYDQSTFNDQNEEIADSMQSLEDYGIATNNLDAAVYTLRTQSLDDYMRSQIQNGKSLDEIKANILSLIDQTGQDLNDYLVKFGHGFLLVNGDKVEKISTDTNSGTVNQLAPIRRAIKFMNFLRVAQDTVKNYKLVPIN